MQLISQQFTKLSNIPPTSVDIPAFTCAWGDYDNDGYLDLFVGNAMNSGYSNSLYHNNGDGTFTRVNNSVISIDVGTSWGCSWGDYNNDSYIDLYVTNGNYQSNFFYVNNGDGTFTKNTTSTISSAALWDNMPAWVDYDNDGLLDLFLTSGYLSSPWFELNSFYHQEGLDFEKITTGDIVTDNKNSHGVCWVDYDLDGDSDCFIANWSGGALDIYNNNGDGTFNHLNQGTIPEMVVNGGGFSFADIDNDKDMDAFLTVIDGDNKLFINEGNGNFTEVTTGEIVNDGMPSYCAGFADFDNDGDIDLVVANVLPSSPNGTFNLLYSNNGDGTFNQITDDIVATDQGQGGGVTWGDYDKDGDVDLYIARYNQSNGFYKNNGNSNHWINIKLIGLQSNKSGIGSKIFLKANIENPVWQTREIFSQTSYQSQNSLNAHFGLKNAEVIDSLVIEWPSGITDFFFNVEVDQFLEVTEGTGVSINEKKKEDVIKVYPNPTYSIINIEFPIIAEYINIQIFDMLGQEVFFQENTNLTIDQPITINLNNLSIGLYSLIITGNDLLFSQKIIKQ